MFGSRMAAMMLAALLGTVAWAAENPLKKTDVGDWIQFKSTITETTEDEGTLPEMTHKVILAAKDGDKAVLVSEMRMEGQLVMRYKETVDLDKEFDAVSVLAQGSTDDLKKTGEGKETLALMGKEFASNWISYTLDGVDMDEGEKVEVKVWFTPELMLGVAKMEMSISDGTDTAKIDILAAGTGKGEVVADLADLWDMSNPPEMEIEGWVD